VCSVYFFLARRDVLFTTCGLLGPSRRRRRRHGTWRRPSQHHRRTERQPHCRWRKAARESSSFQEKKCPENSLSCHNTCCLDPCASNRRQVRQCSAPRRLTSTTALACHLLYLYEEGECDPRSSARRSLREVLQSGYGCGCQLAVWGQSETRRRFSRATSARSPSKTKWFAGGDSRAEETALRPSEAAATAAAAMARWVPRPRTRPLSRRG